MKSFADGPQDNAGPMARAIPSTSFTIAVRELCAFAAKTGDLDLRFTPAPSAQEGIAGHQAVAARRGAGYRAELPLSGQHGPLTVRGRADGFDPAEHRLDEVKTFKGDLAQQPANHRALHWAQAKMYAALLCAQEGHDGLTVALVYWDIGRQQETRFSEQHSADELQRFFTGLCARFLAWAEQEMAHRAARDAALATLPFVHPTMRPGQRQLAENVFRAARSGRCLLAQAPTGIGKTLGSIFPLLKAAAAPDVGLDKLFYLSAKGSGRALALDALATVRRQAPALPLRVVELVSRDTACLHPDKACHGESCPLARGFYDRLPAARAAAVAQVAGQGTGPAAGPALLEPAMGPALLGAAAVRALAEAHAVCPYYLSQELVRWADVVVGDYNYLFDASALLAGLLQANGWRVGVLVDEAHNLVERARGMYSATLGQPALRALRRGAPAALKRPLDRLNRAWQALTRQSGGEGVVPGVGVSDGSGVAGAAYTVLPELPAAWLEALQDATTAIGDWLSAPPLPGSPPQPPDAALMAFYFDALLFTRLAEGFGPHAMADLTRRTERGVPGTELAIRNVLPAPYLRPRFALTRTTVLFSATLAPPACQADLLGLPDDTAWLDVAGPFRPEQLQVRLAPQISTRWAERTRSCGPVADAIAALYAAEPGNYLAFFSSFDYLAQVAAVFAERHLGITHWCQQRGMGDAARQAFIDRFTSEGQGIGFAVLGGAFGEGIDLPGRRLIGAVIATLGLPQFNPVNEQMRRQLDALFPGRGYDYTYLYPGIRKVVQAAGRVIRTPEDHGTVLLIDDRWRDPALQALLPAWWAVPGRDEAPGLSG